MTVCDSMRAPGSRCRIQHVIRCSDAGRAKIVRQPDPRLLKQATAFDLAGQVRFDAGGFQLGHLVSELGVVRAQHGRDDD